MLQGTCWLSENKHTENKHTVSHGSGCLACRMTLQCTGCYSPNKPPHNTLCGLQLYDAALVANKEHAAAYHGWGLLEKREGNFKKARDIWMRVNSLLSLCT